MNPCGRLGRILLVATLGIGDVSCDRAARGGPRLGGEVVAIVDGEAIRVAEVRVHAEAHALTARQSLTELEDSLVLAAEARRRGLRIDTARLHDRVLVQLLLRRIEREHEASSIPESAVDANRPLAETRLRERSPLEPAAPPSEEEIVAEARGLALVRARGDAVGAALRAQRDRVRIDYREAVVAAIFGRSDVFEAIR